MFFFNRVQVSEVLIEGNSKVNAEDIKNIAFEKIDNKILNISFLKTKSIFLINTENIKKEILNKFAKIETVEVKKTLFQTINIYVKERTAFANYCQQENCFLIDKNGVIFEEIGNNRDGDMFIVRQLTDSNVFTGEQVINQNIMDAIYKINQALKNNFQIDLEEALVSNPLKLDILTGEGWRIYFNPKEDIDSQITRFETLLKDDTLQKNRSKLRYIDMRFADKAYIY